MLVSWITNLHIYNYHNQYARMIFASIFVCFNIPLLIGSGQDSESEKNTNENEHATITCWKDFSLSITILL